MLLGIDAGVRYIGYAVTDDKYSVMRIHGKRAIGTFKISEADTAKTRRMHRTNKRRLNRRRFRIALLQEIFNDEMMKRDSNFFHRLNENDLKQEHRSINIGKSTVEKIYSLFNDRDYTDVQYYKQYPTIYHLRNALMIECPDDIRLLYLAVHHIIKYRGHFLLPGELKSDGDSIPDIGPAFQRINELIEQLNYAAEDDDISESYNTFDLSRLDELKDLASNRGKIIAQMLEEKKSKVNNDGKIYKPYIAKKDKIDKACELLKAKDKFLKGLVKAFFGYEINISTLFDNEKYPKDDVKKFYLSDDLENADDIKLLESDNTSYELIFQCKEVYNWLALNELLKGSESISAAMVGVYETHKKDLNDLKSIIKNYAPGDYEMVFGTQDEKTCNYSHYIGGGRYDGIKVGNNGRFGNTCLQEDFYKFIKKILNSIDDEKASELKQNILQKIENKEFLPKITSVNNSTIPYQLNMLELNKILEKAAERFEFLNYTDDCYDEDGNPEKWSNIKKIKSLLEFKIDYYVGPVKLYKDDDKKSKYAWAVRTGDGRVTPWTYTHLIDKEKSNDLFISKMSSNCSYIKGAKALPKNSVLFSKFNCLNELNNLKINGQKISVAEKQNIFNAVYMAKNPTIKKLRGYLITIGYDKSNLVISGVDEKLHANMNAYLLYKDALGDKADNEPKMIERLILLSTVHPNSKMVEKSIRKEFPDKLTEDEIKIVKGFKFNGWSSLSAELLEGYKNDGIKLIYNGELANIVDIMYDYNVNLQEIIAKKGASNFDEALRNYYEEKNISERDVINYEYIENLYSSPSVKKCVWQSFNLIKDIIKQTKQIPERIFIESTRHDEKKERKKSRRAIIESLYQEITARNGGETYSDKLECEKILSEITDSRLESKKYYLYFMQLGKCMYSGEPIPFNELAAGNYDIDHIYPQSKIKDDSFNNIVLVKKELNRDEKKAEYPIPAKLKQYALWKHLLDAKLISAEKYSRLIRSTPISQEEQEKFINRQLVETNQTVILLKDILVKYLRSKTGQDYTDRIVMSRGSIVSDFRGDFGLTKLREANDFHHAHDAYLNIVAGDILNKKYNKQFYLYNKADKSEDASSPELKSYNMAKALSSAVKQNNNEILTKIEKELRNGDVRLVNSIEENCGELYKATICPASENPKYPLEESRIIDGVETRPKCDSETYGGYKSSGTAYFLVIDCEDKKGKTVRKITDITVYENEKLKSGKITLDEIFAARELANAKLARVKGLSGSKLKIGSLLEITDKNGDSYKLNLAGYSSDALVFHNANPLLISIDETNYIKEIVNSIDKVNRAVKKSSDKNGNERNVKLEKLIEENKRRIENRKINRNTSGIGVEKPITVISKDGNLKIYDLFVKKLSVNPYKGIPAYNKLLNTLVRAKDDFENKELYEQIVTLYNCLKAFQCNPDTVDVSCLSYCEKGKEIKGKENACKIIKSVNSVMSDWTIDYIRQSKSGLYEQKIRLN